MSEPCVDDRAKELLSKYQEARPSNNHNLPWEWYSGVYFVELPGFIKIGYAHDVRERFQAIKQATPFDAKPVAFIECGDEVYARSLEQAIHEKFAVLRVKRREWFRDDPTLRSFIAEIATRWPAPKPKST